jgi:OmpA-OmpF porin, OOP family
VEIRAAHTDTSLLSEDGLKLSENRSAAVRSYLAQQGVPAGTMIARGYGAYGPVASDESPEGWRRNRRVEVGIE